MSHSRSSSRLDNASSSSSSNAINTGASPVHASSSLSPTYSIVDLQSMQRSSLIQMLQSSNNTKLGSDDDDTGRTSHTGGATSKSLLVKKKSIKDTNDLGKSLTDLKINKWRVLVLDQACRDILTPVLKVGDLRALGITLLLSIHDENRQQIPDAPAIYFVMPTDENIDLIVRVCVLFLANTTNTTTIKYE